MPTRATVFQVTQVGVESTPGTSVAANRRFGALAITPNVDADISAIRPQGYKFATAGVLNKELVKGKISGGLSYNDIVYILSALLTTPTVTQISPPSGTAYRWVFTPNTTNPDTPKTLTVEVGSSDRAHRFTFGLVTDLSIDIDRDAVDVSGTIIGQALQDPITLTANPTMLAPVLAMPPQVAVYIDSTAAGIGTTKFTRVLSASFSVSSRYKPVFTLDSGIGTSFADYVETPPEAQLELTFAADSQAMPLLATMRGGDKRFIRLEFVGPLIEQGNNYRFTVDMCGVITDVGDFSDEDGVFAVSFTFNATYDSGFGKAFEVRVVNALSAL